MDDPALAWVSTLGLAMGAAWVSGLRLYGCVATLGWLSFFHLVRLPGQMQVVAHPWVIGVATALFVVEFFAEKIPWLDSGWHVAHTFLAVPAGAVLASTAFAKHEPWVVAVAFLLGGGVAFAALAGKATTRAAVNLSPEPVSNVVTSLAEDVAAPLVLASAIWFPFLALVAVGLLCAASFLVARWVWRRRKQGRA